MVFERTRFELDVPEGGRVLDLCDDHPLAAIPYSCRRANCGTCRVEVREGIELCEPAADDERDLSRIFHDPPTVRLACQLRILPGDGRVRLWVVL